MNVSNYKSKKFLDKYKKRPLGHKYIIFPALLKLLGNIKGKQILDLGCGQGDFSRLLASKGALVSAIDQSDKWQKIWREEDVNKIDYLVMDGSKIKKLKSNYFDAVVMNMVILNVSTRSKLSKIFKECSRILKKGGRLIFSDASPVSKGVRKTSLKKIIPKNGFSYFKNGSGYTSEVFLEDYSKIKFDDLHWTLEFLTSEIGKNRFHLVKIIEPQPIKNAPSIFKNYNVPYYIVFEYQKR